MKARAKPQQHAAVLPAPSRSHKWLLFVHQLPSRPSNLRVRTWRRLQQLGAIPVRQAVYVLPDTPSAREGFEWLKAEIETAGGGASVFAADTVDSWSEDTLVEEFRRSRQQAYTALAGDVERVLGRLTAPRRSRGTRAPAVRRLVEIFRQRLTEIEQVDFFGSAGRDRVATLLEQLEDKSSAGTRPALPSARSGGTVSGAYVARTWVTRPRPGVDRMASAWLIKRFIDAQARFEFAAARESVPPEAIPFDMFVVEFSHQGEGCTFETLCAAFNIQQSPIVRLAAVVHDLDLKDAKFGAPEAATLGSVIHGLQLSISDDDSLLNQGMTLFESLYRSFEHSARSAGPRPVARQKLRAPVQRTRRIRRRRR